MDILLILYVPLLENQRFLILGKINVCTLYQHRDTCLARQLYTVPRAPRPSENSSIQNSYMPIPLCLR